MPDTAWNTPITFSWELEGKTLDVLRWFAPRPDLVDRDVWTALDLPARKAFFREHLRPKWHTVRGGPGLTWNDFQHLDRIPAFEITQEVWPLTWELRTVAPYPTAVDQLFNAMEVVRTGVPKAGDGFQVHIVFDLPDGPRAIYAEALVGLFAVLNDYAMSKMYRRIPLSIEDRTVGAMTMDGIWLKDQVSGNAPLEVVRNEPEGRNRVSGAKFNFVGLRTMYDVPTNVGLEIREGWLRDYGRFRRLIERVVIALQQLSPVDPIFFVKVNRPPDTVNDFTVLNHLTFLRRAAEKLPGKCEGYLIREAEAVAESGKYGGPPFPNTRVEGNRDGGTMMMVENQSRVLLRRWKKAMVRWELHPAFRNSEGRRAEIVAARTEFVDKVSTYLTKVYDIRVPKSKRLPRQDHVVHEAVGHFFGRTRLYQYL